LEDEHFAIAEKILRSFIAECRIGGDAFIVLNGLPRHVGQADRVDSIVDVRTVVQLSCTPPVVLERIRRNAGGDRTGRTDDDVESVTKKLAIFNERTAPLLRHYRADGVPILTVEVSAATTAEDMRRRLGKRPSAPSPGMEAGHDA
jgi:adenylate kinase family enzyme